MACDISDSRTKKAHMLKNGFHGSLTKITVETQ